MVQVRCIFDVKSVVKLVLQYKLKINNKYKK